MALYILNQDKLSSIKEAPSKLEKDIQKMCENNLNEVFNLDFVSSEFSVNNFRIDTLAFNKESKSFVIIEYKRGKNFSVIDQGYAYLSVMLNNKSDFILEYNEHCKNNLKRNDIDWSQSKIIFISPAFTSYQRESINFRDLPIELWEIKKYSNQTINFNFLSTSGANESIKTISKGNKEIKKVNKEIEVYTEEKHLLNIPEDIKELYEKFKESILNISENMTIKITKNYIAFVDGKNIADIVIQKKALKIWINAKYGDIDDSKKIFKDVSNTGHWGNGDYEIQVNNDENLEYIISLIKQNHRMNLK